MDTSAPFLPSDLEAANFYCGLPSKPILVARSNRDVWKPIYGPYTYVKPKMLTPLGPHLLNRIWDDTVSIALEHYLQEQGVQYTSITPLRIGEADEESPPAVLFMGVRPGSLTREKGYEVAMHCYSILIQNNITDVHVQIRESEASLSAASLFKPTISGTVADKVFPPFSTSLGIPICNADTPQVEGTGGFFFTRKGTLFMLTARHVVFDPNTVANEHYEYMDGTGAARINVLIMGKAAFDTRIQDIQDLIDEQSDNITSLEKRLALSEDLLTRKEVQFWIDRATRANEVLERLQKDVKRDWADETQRIIGHVVFSPRLEFGVAEGRYTEDWAVIEIHPDMINRENFVGNAIDLGQVTATAFKKWMDPPPAAPHSFDYPTDGLHRCHGILSDKEMLNLTPKTKDPDNAPTTIMALQNGNASGLQVGRVNTIHSVVRRYSDSGNLPAVSSREVAVLPRTSTSGPFSRAGDSGAGVVAADGRMCGLLTGGDGVAEELDMAYLTPMDFIVERMGQFGMGGANFFPSEDDLA